MRGSVVCIESHFLHQVLPPLDPRFDGSQILLGIGKIAEPIDHGCLN